jgi:hypothetical protein
MSRHWTFPVYGDVGAGGSDRTWEAAATINYKFTKGAVTGGWRHPDVDYDSGGFRLQP